MLSRKNVHLTAGKYICFSDLCSWTEWIAATVTLIVACALQAVLAAGSKEPPAGPSRLQPTFITTWSCPYAQRTWIALNAKQLQFSPVFVDL